MMRRQNNFDFLRLTFAILVLVSHSFDLLNAREPLMRLSYNQTKFSDLGLYGFFIISGYLVYKSFENSKSFLEFIAKRALRIFPALLLILLVTLPLLFLFYTGSSNYWSEPTVHTYVFNNLSLYFIQLGIQGIFISNPHGTDINGNLWTLSYEFTFYLFLTIFFLIKKHDIITKFILSALAIYLIYKNVYGIENIDDSSFLLKLNHLYHFGAFFIVGALISSFHKKNETIHYIIIFAAFIILLSCLIFNSLHWLKYLALPIFILGLGTQNRILNITIPHLSIDLSYGIYLSSFLIQQILIALGCRNVYVLCILSLGLSIVYAYCSWHLIEKKAIQLKKYFNPIQT